MGVKWGAVARDNARQARRHARQFKAAGIIPAVASVISQPKQAGSVQRDPKAVLAALQRRNEEADAYGWQEYCHRVDELRALAIAVYKTVDRRDLYLAAMAGGIHEIATDADDTAAVVVDLKAALGSADAFTRATVALCRLATGEMIGAVPAAVYTAERAIRG